jgi:hypothetical protein
VTLLQAAMTNSWRSHLPPKSTVGGTAGIRKEIIARNLGL